jgi:iron complex transport system substrate-binding protein
VRAAALPGLLLAVALPCLGADEFRVRDDSGRDIQLAQPARRIVALSPHTVELSFAAGAGDRLIGVTAWSDFPPQAAALPQVGDAARIDRERLLALEPDLILAWPDGNRAQDLDWLERRGLPLYRSAPHRLADIPAALRAIGRLTAIPDGETAAQAFEQRLAQLRARFAAAPARRVFYQLWPRPLLTLAQAPLLDEVLGVCRADNIFGHLAGVAPAVAREAVIGADPDAILAAAEPGDPDPFAAWRRWSGLQAVRQGRLIALPAELLQRPTPRLLDGLERLCGELGD